MRARCAPNSTQPRRGAGSAAARTASISAVAAARPAGGQPAEASRTSTGRSVHTRVGAPPAAPDESLDHERLHVLGGQHGARARSVQRRAAAARTRALDPKSDE